MALAIIAATMLVSTVVVETLSLFDDAEANKSKQKNKCSRFSKCSNGGHGSPGNGGGNPGHP